MANYLLTIDPVLLLTDKQMSKITKDKKDMQNNGTAGDAVKEVLQHNFEFADVFQSTYEEHTIKVHDTLMADKIAEKAGRKGTTKMGDLKTPTGLIAYVTVTEEWIKNHPEETKAGVCFELDPRIDPKELHANDGATKDGDSAGFVRYGKYKTPLMTMLPKNKKLENEKIEDMELAADQREKSLRERTADTFKNTAKAFQNASRGSYMQAFIYGFKLGSSLGKKPEKDNAPESSQNGSDASKGKGGYTHLTEGANRHTGPNDSPIDQPKAQPIINEQMRQENIIEQKEYDEYHDKHKHKTVYDEFTPEETHQQQQIADDLSYGMHDLFQYEPPETDDFQMNQ